MAIVPAAGALAFFGFACQKNKQFQLVNYTEDKLERG